MEDDKPQILLWTAPQFAWRVTVPATVLNEVRIHAVEAFYSVPRGGVEIGGVFFGVHERDSVHIQAHRQIRCEYSTGPSFTLSVNDQLGLSGLLDQSASDPDLAGMKPVGWYHSHTRSDLFLSPVDLQLYNEFFHERWQIAMVLRPVNLKPTKAGFFFRDKSGNVKSDAPVQEFKLEPPGFGLTLLDGYDAAGIPQKLPPAAPVPAPTPEPEPPPPAVPAVVAGGSAPPAKLAVAAVVDAPKPAQEPAAATEKPPVVPEPPPAAIVAVASGNGSGVQMAKTPAAASPVPAVALEPEPVAKLVSGPAPATKPEAAGKPEPVTRLDAPVTPEQETKSVHEQLVEIGLRSFDLAEVQAREKRRTGWIWTLVILLLLSAGGGAAFLKWGRIGSAVGLGLETYDINGAFLIRWDRLSPPILQASHATLEIEDGGRETEPVPLSPGELAVGGYGYMRRTSRVSVHLTVEGKTPMDEYSNFEAVRALGSKPPDSPEVVNNLTLALEEKEHLKTELINESMQSTELRREIKSLRKQLAEARAKNASDTPR